MTMTKFKKAMREGERGNVLFLILIAVALFAALSYAVTQSTRSGGGDAGRETNRISSAQMTQYPAGIRTSLVRMIIGGQDVSTLEFNAPADFGSCTAGPPNEFQRCVFHPTGGGATYATAPGELMAGGTAGTWVFNMSNEIENIGTTNTGGAGGANSSTADLIAFLPGVAQGVCDSINEQLGIPTAIASITEDDIVFTSASNMDVGAAPFATATSILGDGVTIGEAAAALSGQPFGCFYDSNGNADNLPAAGYVYYHVLIER